MSEDLFIPHKRERYPRKHKIVRLDQCLLAQEKNCVDYNGSNDSRVMCECIKSALKDLHKGFEIKSDLVISGVETIQFRIEQDWIDWIKQIAKEYDTSFDKVVNQCVDYVINVKYGEE